MTASHMHALLRQLPPSKRGEVQMYRSFDPDLPTPKAGHESQIDLVDPWYGGQHEFEVAIDQIEHVAPYIVDWVERQLQGCTAAPIDCAVCPNRGRHMRCSGQGRGSAEPDALRCAYAGL